VLVFCCPTGINVSIPPTKGGKQSIIGEVQFLLREFLENKKLIHELYTIVRKQELFNDVKKNLELVDATTRFFSAIQLGDTHSVASFIASGFDAHVLMGLTFLLLSPLTKQRLFFRLCHRQLICSCVLLYLWKSTGICNATEEY